MSASALPFPPGLLARDWEEGRPHASGPGATLLPTAASAAVQVIPLVACRAPEREGTEPGVRPGKAGGEDGTANPVPPPGASPSPARQRRRHIGARALLAALAALLGLVLCGQGLWIHAKAILAQVLLERAFTESVRTGQPVKSWSWADTWPVARIEVPRLHASEIALAGASGQALAFGPGHVARTPEPGEPGTAVYAAHRDTSFAFLADVRVGDEIRVTRRDGRAFRFRVTGTSVARWDASGIDPAADGRHLVLATCWPLDATTSGPLRYLVHADLAADVAAVPGPSP